MTDASGWTLERLRRHRADMGLPVLPPALEARVVAAVTELEDLAARLIQPLPYDIAPFAQPAGPA